MVFAIPITRGEGTQITILRALPLKKRIPEDFPMKAGQLAMRFFSLLATITVPTRSPRQFIMV